MSFIPIVKSEYNKTHIPQYIQLTNVIPYYLSLAYQSCRTSFTASLLSSLFLLPPVLSQVTWYSSVLHAWNTLSIEHTPLLTKSSDTCLLNSWKNLLSLSSAGHDPVNKIVTSIGTDAVTSPVENKTGKSRLFLVYLSAIETFMDRL